MRIPRIRTCVLPAGDHKCGGDNGIRYSLWFFLGCMYVQMQVENVLHDGELIFLLDASVLPAMVGSTAATDAEIGARLGVCFTFTGAPIFVVKVVLLLTLFTGFGGLIGITGN